MKTVKPTWKASAIPRIGLRPNILGINLYGAENAIVAFMPLLSGIGSLIDTAIAMLGASVVSSAAGTDIEVPYRDTI